jgi:hypothetical protein
VITIARSWLPGLVWPTGQSYICAMARLAHLRLSLPPAPLLVMVLTVVAAAPLPPLAAAQPLKECEYGQPVIDARRNVGQIVDEHDGLCLVRSPDGRLQSWVSPTDLSPFKPTPIAAAPPPPPPEPAEVGAGSEPTTVLGPVEPVAPVDFGWPVVVVRERERMQRHLPSPGKFVARASVPVTHGQVIGFSRAGLHPHFRRSMAW